MEAGHFWWGNMAVRAKWPRDSAGGSQLRVPCVAGLQLSIRACAVFGGTYILGPSSIPDSTEIVTEEDGRPVVKLKLPCHPRVITAKHLITSPDHLPFSLISTSSTSTRRISAHCTAIVSALPEALRWPPKITTSEADGDAGEEEQGAEGEEDDAAIVVFPPEGENGVVRAIMMGEGTGSCPAGQCKPTLPHIVRDHCQVS